MKYSVALPQSARVGSTAAIHDAAQAAEELGFWAVSMHDHIVFDGGWLLCGAEEDDGVGDRRNVFEHLTTFSYVAGITSTVKLLSSVLLLPVRATIVTAKQIATLDNLSGGRVVLGVGVGLSGTDRDPEHVHFLSKNAKVELAALKVPVTRRGEFGDEQIAAFKEIWTQDVASFHGKHINFDDIQIFPKPVQPGGPPIYIGGASPAAIRRAARGGYTWLPGHALPEEIAAGLDALSELDGSRTRECAVDLFFSMTTTKARPTALEKSFGDQLPLRNLVGTPEYVTERIRLYRDAGANTLELKPVYRNVDEYISLLETFMTEVAPAV